MSAGTVIAIDNGTTGSIGVVFPDCTALFFGVPTKDAVHYSKAGKLINRIDVPELVKELNPYREGFAYIERPFTGSPMMVNTSLLSARAHEATMIALELAGIGYQTIDSREWQKNLLPGVTGSDNLKKASKAKGIQLYPQLKLAIEEHGDADGLLIAHYYAHRGSKL